MGSLAIADRGKVVGLDFAKGGTGRGPVSTGGLEDVVEDVPEFARDCLSASKGDCKLLMILVRIPKSSTCSPLAEDSWSCRLSLSALRTALRPLEDCGELLGRASSTTISSTATLVGFSGLTAGSGCSFNACSSPRSELPFCGLS